MKKPRILSIQDLSCFGQCSTTVALPILSACGYETAVLPTAILSTHTYQFKDYIYIDLTDKLNDFINHWKKENIKFDVIYTGYLGNINEIKLIDEIHHSLVEDNNLLVVDPAMGDDGRLYPSFNQDYVDEMKNLINRADIIIPNVTELCFLTGNEYKDKHSIEYISKLIHDLPNLEHQKVVVTGIHYSTTTIGVAVYEDGNINFYEHARFKKGCHGTGDVYASIFIAMYLDGHSLFESSKIAADFTYQCIKNTRKDEDHWYGVEFEPLLKDFINK